ncbi:unnamed protein product [Haemonchus placei]|uniref:Legumain n=1 Tax=Haemonchus placei TaxID=6290 RepID=A0A0N4X8J6_HAEPC|nr:unnamed protein product [Haemonchus placei]
MMFDDIANHAKNPYRGKLFNHPNGSDVYAGLKIDYRGSSVTSENFLAVLKGDKDAVKGGNGRVIESTEDDRIFVYFSDHGSIGLIAFPDDHLTAKRLHYALKEMHENHKFGQLVFYLEACESGSMFNTLLKNDMNIYAITAANGIESSYATYCGNDLNLPCLGDEFSVNWMEDSDRVMFKSYMFVSVLSSSAVKLQLPTLFLKLAFVNFIKWTVPYSIDAVVALK